MAEDLTVYTPTERVLLIVSQLVAQSQLVLNSVAAGKEHRLGVYENQYGKVIQPGKPQRKRLVGMIVVGDVLQAITDAFIEARESPEGQALLAKVDAHRAAVAEQESREVANADDQPHPQDVPTAG